MACNFALANFGQSQNDLGDEEEQHKYSNCGLNLLVKFCYLHDLDDETPANGELDQTLNVFDDGKH